MRITLFAPPMIKGILNLSNKDKRELLAAFEAELKYINARKKSQEKKHKNA